LEDRQEEEREGIKKRKSKFDSECPSFLFLVTFQRRMVLRKIYISKPEVCQPFSSKLFSLNFSLTDYSIF
jgi:hypothetical protein